MRRVRVLPRAAGRRSALERGKVGAGDNAWQGAFARLQGASAADELLRVPDGLSLRHAALVEPLAVALHGITRSGGARPGARVLVTGGGPIGFLSVAALNAAGVDDIVVSEPHERPPRALRERSARAAVDPSELLVPAMPHDLVDEPFDVVLECSGQRAKRWRPALAQLKRAGTLVLVGAGMQPAAVRQQPHPAERADDHRRVRLRRRRLPARARAARVGSGSRLDLLVEPDDVPLDGLLDARSVCTKVELAAKVMVVPDAEQGES